LLIGAVEVPLELFIISKVIVKVIDAKYKEKTSALVYNNSLIFIVIECCILLKEVVFKPLNIEDYLVLYL
jgi:hypothetical protein